MSQRTYELEIYVVEGEQPPERQGASISITAGDPEVAAKKVRELIRLRKLPPVRSLNFAPGDKILVYCSEKRQRRPNESSNRIVWRRPPGEEST